MQRSIPHTDDEWQSAAAIASLLTPKDGGEAATAAIRESTAKPTIKSDNKATKLTSNLNPTTARSDISVVTNTPTDSTVAYTDEYPSNVTVIYRQSPASRRRRSKPSELAPSTAQPAKRPRRVSEAEKRREANRMNAKKSRLRKKVYIESLMQRLAEVEAENGVFRQYFLEHGIALPASAPPTISIATGTSSQSSSPDIDNSGDSTALSVRDMNASVSSNTGAGDGGMDYVSPTSSSHSSFECSTDS